MGALARHVLDTPLRVLLLKPLREPVAAAHALFRRRSREHTRCCICIYQLGIIAAGAWTGLSLSPSPQNPTTRLATPRKQKPKGDEREAWAKIKTDARRFAAANAIPSVTNDCSLAFDRYFRRGSIVSWELSARVIFALKRLRNEPRNLIACKRSDTLPSFKRAVKRVKSVRHVKRDENLEV